MKIMKQTATELKIQTRGVFDFWLHSCLLIIIGLKWAVFDCHLATFNCRKIQATQGNCQLVISNWLGSNTQEIELATLQEAKVVKSGYSSRVIMVTDAGDIPFTHHYTHWGNKESIAAEINDFVKNAERKELELKHHEVLFECLGGLFLIAGIAVIALGKKETYSFDLTSDKLTVKQQSLLVSKVIQYPLQEIYGVEVKEFRDRDNDSWYEIQLLRKEGKRLSLANTINPYKQQEIAKTINNFLHARYH